MPKISHQTLGGFSWLPKERKPYPLRLRNPDRPAPAGLVLPDLQLCCRYWIDRYAIYRFSRVIESSV